MASDGGQIKYDVNDLASLSFDIKEVLKGMRIGGFGSLRRSHMGASPTGLVCLS